MENNEQPTVTTANSPLQPMAVLESCFGIARCAAWRERLVEHWRTTVLVHGLTTSNESILLEIFGWDETPEVYAEHHLLRIASNFFRKLLRRQYRDLSDALECKYNYGEIELTILPILRLPVEGNRATRTTCINGFVQLTGIVRNGNGDAWKLASVCINGLYEYRADPVRKSKKKM